MNPVMVVGGLSRHFGGVAAVSEVSMAVPEGEILGLIGPNGAGKTTLVNMLAGYLRPSAGRILFKGTNINDLPAYKVAQAGVRRTFQVTNGFPPLTVRENLRTAAHALGHSGFLAALAHSRAYRQDEQQADEEAAKALAFIGLEAKAGEEMRTLPYGEQRLVSLGIALVGRPSLLLLDEPAAGLSPVETERLANLIRRIKAEGITIILVEHNVQMIMNLCDSIVVLSHGEKIAEGEPAAVAANPAVIEAYLGEEELAC